MGQQPASNVAQEERADLRSAGWPLECRRVDGSVNLRGRSLQQTMEPELGFAHVGIVGGSAEPATRGRQRFEHAAAIVGRTTWHCVAECQADEAGTGEAALHGLCADDGGWIYAQ